MMRTDRQTDRQTDAGDNNNPSAEEAEGYKLLIADAEMYNNKEEE